MARQAKKRKKVAQKRHSQAFKDESLALAEKVGVRAAARDLWLHESQLYDDGRKKIRTQP